MTFPVESCRLIFSNAESLFFPNENEILFNSMDLILKKSIELAKAAYKKNKNEISTSSQLYEYSAELQPNLGDYFEETKL